MPLSKSNHRRLSYNCKSPKEGQGDGILVTFNDMQWQQGELID